MVEIDYPEQTLWRKQIRRKVHKELVSSSSQCLNSFQGITLIYLAWGGGDFRDITIVLILDVCPTCFTL